MEIKGSSQKKCFKIEIKLPDELDYAVFVDIEAFNIKQIDDFTIIVDEATKLKFDEKILEIFQTAAKKL